MNINITRPLGAAAAVLCLLVSALAQQNSSSQPAPIRSQMTAEKWREDLRFFAERMPATHKNLFHKMSKVEFDAAVKHLDEKIPTLADHEVIVELMRIIAKVGDGHTGAHSAQFLFAGGVYPVQFHLFEDGLHIRRASAEHANVNGGRVVRIGDLSAEEAMKRVAEIVWRDNDMGIKDIGPRLLSSPQVLHALRISNALESVKITVMKDGREVTSEMKPDAKAADLRTGTTSLVDSRASGTAQPLWLKNPGDNFWYEFLPEKKVMFVQFNAVQNKQNETVEAFFNKVFDFAEKNPVEKLVLDLRMNGGGNNFLNLPLTLRAIRSPLNQTGKFFVIIGRETFSAAQNTVNELEKYTNVIFVGEPTAATPNHYGDAARITLPNSKLTVQASTLWWQDADPRDRRQWKAPDVAADLTFDAYRQGRDPAMEAIQAYKPSMSLNAIVADARSTQNVDQFITRLREFEANPAHKYAETEAVINDAGYFLLGSDRVEDAIRLFALNVELHSRSVNVYDSLGEAYLKKGDKTNALLNYKKALAIDPTYRTALEAVRSLTQ